MTMKIVRVCGPVAKVVREVADVINGPNVTAPKAIEGPGITFLITDEPLTFQLYAHEMQHVRQAAALEPKWIPQWGLVRVFREWIGWTRFYAEYAAEYARHGYWDNRFEVDARRSSGEES